MKERINRLAEHITDWAGSVYALAAAAGIVLVWAISGPIFGFSDTWQLIINTFTTLITFFMGFIIQLTQNRDSKALHAKMDEILRATNARNELIGIEKLSDEELLAYVQQLRQIGQAARRPNLPVS